MKKQKEKGMARRVYVTPRVEVHPAEPSALLAGTTIFTGTHEDGSLEHSTGGTHDDGVGEGIVTGAKQMILGREFSFSDLWEE